MESSMDKARQVMEEDSPERTTRSIGKFHEFESDMPTIGSRWNIPMLDNITSYLGGHNPIAKDVNPAKESVWLLDNTAYRPVHPYPHPEQPFQAEFVAAYFQKNTGKDMSKAVAVIAEKLGLKDKTVDGADARKIIAQRLQPFVDTIAPARYVNVEFAHNGRNFKLGPGGRSAVSTDVVTIHDGHLHGPSSAVHTIPRDLAVHGSMTTYFADVEGWLVVSDIDDSIKVTMTPSPIGILQTTFIDDPTPITGMPELYAQIQATLSPTWFYLSASPYNLYPFLRTFLHKHYPPGPILLRDASWMDLGGFLASLTQGTEAYKRTRMDKIHECLPRRKVLCVGDSTQSDPEAYGDICRKYPGWVHKVFIRKVVDVAEMKGSGKNDDKRFQTAFKDVDPSIWQTFIDPKECADAIAALKSS